MIPFAPHAQSRDRSSMEHHVDIEALVAAQLAAETNTYHCAAPAAPPPIAPFPTAENPFELILPPAASNPDAVVPETLIAAAIEDPAAKDPQEGDAKPYLTLTTSALITPRPPVQRGPDPRQPRGHRLLSLLTEARGQRVQRANAKSAKAPRSIAPIVVHTRAQRPDSRPEPRDVEFQISGIRAFISRLECEIATRHGQRAERCLTLRAQRRTVDELEAELSDLRPDIAGQKWIDLVERYNAAKTHLGHLSDLDKRQTAIDLSDDPHMEAELMKWRWRLERVTSQAA